jgi:hypothetical protein
VNEAGNLKREPVYDYPERERILQKTADDVWRIRNLYPTADVETDEKRG